MNNQEGLTRVCCYVNCFYLIKYIWCKFIAHINLFFHVKFYESYSSLTCLRKQYEVAKISTVKMSLKVRKILK